MAEDTSSKPPPRWAAFWVLPVLPHLVWAMTALALGFGVAPRLALYASRGAAVAAAAPPAEPPATGAQLDRRLAETIVANELARAAAQGRPAVPKAEIAAKLAKAVADKLVSPAAAEGVLATVSEGGKDIAVDASHQFFEWLFRAPEKTEGGCTAPCCAPQILNEINVTPGGTSVSNHRGGDRTTTVTNSATTAPATRTTTGAGPIAGCPRPPVPPAATLAR